MCTCFSAANASHASQRPSITLVDRDRRRGRRRLLGACEHQQPVDQAREPRHLGERAVEVLGGVRRARRPRGSRAGAACAASGVRSWCDASATNARCAPTSCSRRAAVALNDSASTVSSAGPFGTSARAARSPAPSVAGRVLEVLRAASSPSGRAAGWRGTRCRARRHPSPRAAARCARMLVVDDRGRVGDAHRALDAVDRADRQRDVEELVAERPRRTRAAHLAALRARVRSRGESEKSRPTGLAVDRSRRCCGRRRRRSRRGHRLESR